MELKSETKYNFSADINQLLNFIVNTIYGKKKELFLKELLTNATDALDKIKYLGLNNKDILNDDPRMIIQIIPNKEKKTLTIRDTGIGMTKSDLIENLGIIAKSGTQSFRNYLKKSNSEKIDLTGQFGIGFYSAYLVADKVMVITKNYDDTHYVWQSNADGYFTIGETLDQDIINSLSRGTSIILHMKDDTLDFLEENKLKNLIKNYSQYINFPIELHLEKEVMFDNKENLEKICINKFEENEYQDICNFIRQVLGNKVSKVEISNRNIDSSCILSTTKHVWSTNVDIIFEINPNSSTIKALKNKFNHDAKDPNIKNLIYLLYESAVISSGFTLENPNDFTKRLDRIINLELSQTKDSH